MRNPSSKVSHGLSSLTVLQGAAGVGPRAGGGRTRGRLGEDSLMKRTLLTRRTVLQTTAATALAAPFVRGAYAAGTLSFGVWDHWVPGAAEVLKKICADWG